MKILRTIVAIVIGAAVASLSVMVVHMISSMMYPLPEGTDPSDMEALKRIMPTMPMGALAMVLLGWETGAFVGGATAALIAGRARVLHAGVVGAWVLLGTVIVLFLLPHTAWMAIAGILLPIPVALVAGKLVSVMLPSPAGPAPENVP